MLMLLAIVSGRRRRHVDGRPDDAACSTKGANGKSKSKSQDAREQPIGGRYDCASSPAHLSASVPRRHLDPMRL